MKRKYRELLFLVLSVLMVAGALYISPYISLRTYTYDYFPGLLSTESEALTAGKTELFSDEVPEIYFGNYHLPYDAASCTLYLPQNIADSEWQGCLTSGLRGYKLYTSPDSLWSDKAEAIRTSHTFTIWLASQNSFYEYQLCITGTPLMSITTDSVRPPKEYDYDIDPDGWVYDRYESYVGSMVLFDPEGEGSVAASPLVYHQKGSSTAGLPKSGYSLSLETVSGKKQNLSLLGMRSDNSWKLNALYTDPTRVREMTATQIWQKIDAADSEVSAPGCDMRYIEVILDNSYQGLYALVEPIDADKLSLDQNDVLYKVLDWSPPGTDEIQDSINHNWKVRFPVRIRYPKNITDYAAAWYPMQDYVNWVYETAWPDYDEVSAKISLENLCDLTIYTMVTSASDNTFKNTYYAARVADDGSYVMYQLPWDMDLTFGNRYDYNSSIVSVYDPAYDNKYVDAAFLKLKVINPEEVIPLFQERWQQYRADFLSDDALEDLIRSNQEYLLTTGASVRETNRWPESGISTDLDTLLTYQQNRMHWLDNYYETEW